MSQNKKPLTPKVNKKTKPKLISFQDYVHDCIMMLDNNINVLKIEQARLAKRMDDFETWIPILRELKKKTEQIRISTGSYSEPRNKGIRNTEIDNIPEKI